MNDYDLVIKDDPVLCDECKREEGGLAVIEVDHNSFCLMCARDLNIITEIDLQNIKDLATLQGGKIGKAIQKALNKTN